MSTVAPEVRAVCPIVRNALIAWLSVAPEFRSLKPSRMITTSYFLAVVRGPMRPTPRDVLPEHPLIEAHSPANPSLSTSALLPYRELDLRIDSRYSGYGGSAKE